MTIFKLLFLTWNVNHPSPIQEFLPQFSSVKVPNAEILIINLQEICTRSLIDNDKCTNEMNQYIQILTHFFSDYTLLQSLNCQSVALFIFQNKLKSSEIEFNDTKLIKHNNDGKSSIISIFRFNSKEFTIIGNHLEYGFDNYEERNQEWLNIIQNLPNCDYSIMLGDLNYRIDLSRSKTLKRISQKKFDRLLRADQLKMAQKLIPSFDGYEEGKITFPPTYKFDLNSDEYDTSPKQRTPSYTDRILLATFNNNTKPLNLKYDMINTSQSDHRPVYALYEFHL